MFHFLDKNEQKGRVEVLRLKCSVLVNRVQLPFVISKHSLKWLKFSDEIKNDRKKVNLTFYYSCAFHRRFLAWEQELLHETIDKFKILPLVYNNTVLSLSSPNTRVIVQSSILERHKTMVPASSWPWEDSEEESRI